MKKILCFALMSLLVWACGDSSSSAEDSPKEIDVATLCPTDKRGSFTDERDGREYRYTTIGDQVWMAENLAYEKKFYAEDGTELSSICSSGFYNTCYTLPFDGYYPIFLLDSALCPQGWHVPDNDEIDELIENAGSGYAGRILKSKTGWGNVNPDEESNGTDDCGFNLEPGPTVVSKYDMSGLSQKYYGSFMSSTHAQDSSAYSVGSDGVRHYIDVFYTCLFASRTDSVTVRGESYSLTDHIRCIKD